jgi:hypothetical protein
MRPRKKARVLAASIETEKTLRPDPEKSAPDVIGGGHRFSDKILL